MNFYEALETVIKNTLENLDSGKIAKIITVLKDVGVEKHNHLEFLQESDLLGQLNKIQARMLIRSFKNAFKEVDAFAIQKYEVLEELPPQVVLPQSQPQVVLLQSEPQVAPCKLPSQVILPESSSKVVLSESSTQVVPPELPSQEVLPGLSPRVVLHRLPSSSFFPLKSDNGVKISWYRLGERAMHNLENGKEISESDYRTMVRIIADDIMKANSKPSKKYVYKVAEQCVTKYQVLRDKFSSITLGSGYNYLAHRLYTRIENLKRTPRQFAERSPRQFADSPPVKKRRLRGESYGCVAWEVDLPIGITKEELISKKNVLSQLNYKSEMNKAIKLLEETYYLQRTSINNGDTIDQLLKEWPVLFTEQGIKSHFKILTNVCLYETLENNFFSKNKNFMTFWRLCKNNEVQALIAETDWYPETPNQLLLTVLALGKYFGESLRAVIFTDKVLNRRNPTLLPKYPCLVCKGTSILKCKEFMLVIDGIAVNTSFKDPTVAVACWFASYFIFNRMYPIEFSCSLEFFQRCLLGINPVSGSKVRKNGKPTYQGVNPRILKLLQKMNEYDSWVLDKMKRGSSIEQQYASSSDENED